MTTIAPTEDPTSYLTAPNVPGAGSFIWKLRLEAGVIIGGVDTVISAITGFSPLEEWVAKPLGGDWEALDRGSVAWKNAGKSVSAVARNIESLPGQIGDQWQGEAAIEYGVAQGKLSTALSELPDACNSLSEMCAALADMAQAIASFVAMILKQLQNWALKMLAATAIPGGQVTLPLWITDLMAKIANWVPKLTGMITKFVNFLTKIWPIIDKIVKVIQKLQKIVDALSKIVKAIKPIVEGGLGASNSGRAVTV